MEQQTRPDASEKFRFIELDLIDEPPLAMRETMDENELGELALSIREVGLVNPITVRPIGDRFTVIAGHRRRIACGLVNYSPVACYVRQDSEIDHLAVMVAENSHREEVNPIEEARFYQRVLTELCSNDVDLLCLKVRRRRGYVEDRLLLLLGYDTVIQALHERKISIAVARALNKCKQPIRLRLLLDTAISQGATARQVTEWVREGAEQPDVQTAAAEGGHHDMNPAGAPYQPFMTCMFCEDSEDTHLMEIVYMHKPCGKIVRKMLGRLPEQQQQQTPEEPAA